MTSYWLGEVVNHTQICDRFTLHAYQVESLGDAQYGTILSLQERFLNAVLSVLCCAVGCILT